MNANWLDEHSKQLQRLKSQLFSQLAAANIPESCVLLDVPGHMNAGDQLMVLGTYSWLEETERKLHYVCTVEQFASNQVRQFLAQNPGACILFHGGGNMGGLWWRHDHFRKRVMDAFTGRRIIILPQTIFFASDTNRAEIRTTFESHHENLTVFARDQRSFENAQETFLKNDVRLAPDMAMSIGSKLLPSSSLPERLWRTRLLLLRDDQERLLTKANEDFGAEISDWVTFQESAIQRFSRRVKKRLPLLLNKPPEISGMKLFAERVVNRAVEQLTGRKAVITDRLHGSILATLLGIPNVLLPNSYFKNQSVFETWYKDLSLCRFSALCELSAAFRELDGIALSFDDCSV